MKDVDWREVLLVHLLILALMLAMLNFLVVAQRAEAHPGRLDAEGCHEVHTRWVAKDGTVFEPGTKHCHRKLGTMKLDGQERLQEPTVTLPDPTLTPGHTLPVGPAHLCVAGYAATVRHVSESVKASVCASYGAKHCPGPAWEIDHLISLELGGSNEPSNLWPQPIAEARQKDVLENFLHRAVCSGAMQLHEAQRAIAVDWQQAYDRMQGR